MIGLKIIVKNNVIWRDNQGVLMPLSPPSELSNLNFQDASEILENSSSFLLRWESNFDSQHPTHWWHVIKSDHSDLSSLKKKTRYEVRKGLDAFCCEKVTKEVILTYGYFIYKKAFKRYNTHETLYSKEKFDSEIRNLPDDFFEFWIVKKQIDGSPVAFAENFVINDVCFYNTIWFDPDSLKSGVSYALFFEMNRHYLADRSFKYVSDGARSLSHSTAIHDFLISKFGFRKAFATLNIAYKPWFKFLLLAIYPFRQIICKLSFGFSKKACVVLLQEEIYRKHFLND